jgi:hypothetical protein
VGLGAEVEVEVQVEGRIKARGYHRSSLAFNRRRRSFPQGRLGSGNDERAPSTVGTLQAEAKVMR